VVVSADATGAAIPNSKTAAPISVLSALVGSIRRSGLDDDVHSVIGAAHI
jgi:hypothetical protein